MFEVITIPKNNKKDNKTKLIMLIHYQANLVPVLLVLLTQKFLYSQSDELSGALVRPNKKKTTNEANKKKNMKVPEELLEGGDRTRKRIMIWNGEDAPKTAYPWFTKITDNDGFWTTRKCGGVLVAPDFVLTTAWCIKEHFTKDISVRIGAVCQSPNNCGQPSELIPVNSFFSHHYYDFNDNDFALLKLARTATASPASM